MVRLTDGIDITIAVDWDVKPQAKQTNKKNPLEKLKFGVVQ